MGTISLQIPQSGLPNSTEDPKIANDFTILQTLLNGNVDTNNLAPAAAIKVAQMAAGAVRWQYVSNAATTQTLADGQLYQSTANAPVTVTLPAATGGQLCGVYASANASGSQQITLTAAGTDKIFGVGVVGGVASVPLGTPGGFIAVFAVSAGAWVIVSGQQDTGWVAPTLVNAWANAGGYLPAGYRLQGDKVEIRGTVTGGASGSTAFTLPLGYRPTAQATFNNVPGTQYVSVGSNGVVAIGFTGSAPALDNIHFFTS